MGFLDKIIGSGIKDTVSAVGGVIDKISTTDDERMAAKKEITEVITTFAKDISASSAEVLKAEMTGNWLQRSWRPLVMLAFAFIVVYHYFLAPIFHWPMPDLPEQFWSLLEVGMGGYVIGRSVEKIADSVSSNLDKIPRKSKN
jgi:hypothetical protein